MSCGCGSSPSTSPCGGKKKELRIQRNRLVTLYNTTKNPEKRQEYKNLLKELNSLSTTTSCPDNNTILSVKNYLDREYTERNK